MRIYLAGPMRALPHYNFPAFDEAAARLRALGHEVFDPAEHDESNGFDPATAPADLMTQPGVFAHYMSRDLPEVCRSEAVAVLPGWRQSAGARLEVYVAEQVGLLILDAVTLAPARETILEEAQRLVYGDRGAAYGHPREDYTRTAKLWSALLGTEVTAAQAALCMIAVKLSRECHQHKRDNLVDVAGYAAVIDRIETGV